MTLTEAAVKAYLEEQDAPVACATIAQDTGYSLSAVYSALRVIGAGRVRLGRNQFGYILNTAEEFESVTNTLGQVQGRSWFDTALHAMRTIQRASLTSQLSAEQYADGFTSVGNLFLELAAHAAAVQDRPDWKIVLGFETDTEKE